MPVLIPCVIRNQVKKIKSVKAFSKRIRASLGLTPSPDRPRRTESFSDTPRGFGTSYGITFLFGHMDALNGAYRNEETRQLDANGQALGTEAEKQDEASTCVR